MTSVLPVLRGLVAALIAVNVIMFLVFVGAAGSTRQALRGLDGTTVAACARAAEVSAPAAAEYAGRDTITFRARSAQDEMVTVRCTLGPAEEDDGPLTVESVEVAP